MAEYGLPVLAAVLVWWLTTALVLLLDGLPRRTYRWSMLGATSVLAAALYGLTRTSVDTGIGAAYAGFVCGVLVWGWQEMSFLTGTLTGPRRHACPDGCAGWRHFGHAIQAILYHELAIIAGAILVVALTWGQPNRIGTWTYLLLWGMRASAKLNLFFGVRNLGAELLPPHLQYLRSFFRRKPMNLLFPLSVSAATIAALLLGQAATAPGAMPFDVAGLSLLAGMAMLGLLEHWLLVLPLPVEAMWSWGVRPQAAAHDGSRPHPL